MMPALLLLLLTLRGYGQGYVIKGMVRTASSDSVGVQVRVMGAKDYKQTIDIGSSRYVLQVPDTGRYVLEFWAEGYGAGMVHVWVRDSVTTADSVVLVGMSRLLQEVTIRSQGPLAVQKEDTTEYSSSGLKVHADADAADLIKKLPSVEVNGKEVRAQGERVVKVLVDGKPFFGDDAIATLKNLPAEVINKIQVYNERSEQDRFAGAREAAMPKVMNIVTHEHKRNGVFGTHSSGVGVASNDAPVYNTATTANVFRGDRRVTLTGQYNNVNNRSFGEGELSAGGGGSGINKTLAGGVNYTDKWGKKTDASLSYHRSNSDMEVERSTYRQYILPGMANQVYEERSPSNSVGNNNRMNVRVSTKVDSNNTIVVQGNASVTGGNSLVERVGYTYNDAGPINNTRNGNRGERMGVQGGGHVLYMHRFGKVGRTASVNAGGNLNNMESNTHQYASNSYYSGGSSGDTLNQVVRNNQQNGGLNGNVVYTEPVSKTASVKVQYNVQWTPAVTERQTMDQTTTPPLIDSVLSGRTDNVNMTQRGGAGVQLKLKGVEVYASANYQMASLEQRQTGNVVLQTRRSFENVLPTVNADIKLQDKRHLSINYQTATNMPSVSQLQEVASNSDPLHISIGNAALKQSMSHTGALRYSAQPNGGKRSLAVSVTGNVVANQISSASYIAMQDTVIAQLARPAGTQLTVPINVNGGRSVSMNMSYSVPLPQIKCRLNMNVNAAINRQPAVVNGVLNYQQNRNGGVGLYINSALSERVDFSVSSMTMASSNYNPSSARGVMSNVQQSISASVQATLRYGIVVKTVANWQGNYGLSAAYNRSFALWNVSVGKKVLKKKQGEVNVSVYDVLNKNNNINRNITESYIDDVRTNMLQRYVMVSFVYRLSRFGGGKSGGVQPK